MPIRYDLPPMPEVLPPKPSASEFMLIYTPNSATGYLVKNSKTISAIKKEHKSYIENFYCGCGIKGVVGDHNTEYDIYGFGGGWIIDRLPFFEDEVASNFSGTVYSAIENAEAVSIYNFMANNPHKHGENMESINSHPEMYAYYSGYSLTDQYSFITLRYSYDNETREYSDTWGARTHPGSKTILGILACDDIFIPILDYIQENSNFYHLSNISQGMSGHGNGLLYFEREITFYLSNPINSAERNMLEEKWLNLLEKEPYYSESRIGSFIYKEVTQYPITILSEKVLSDADIRELEQIYNLKYVENLQ